jgi:hypothetical protein
MRKAMSDFLVYFGSFYSCEVLTTYARILHALYLLHKTLNIRNFMFASVDLYKIIRMQFIGMFTVCLQRNFTYHATTMY